MKTGKIILNLILSTSILASSLDNKSRVFESEMKEEQQTDSSQFADLLAPSLTEKSESEYFQSIKQEGPEKPKRRTRRRNNKKKEEIVQSTPKTQKEINRSRLSKSLTEGDTCDVYKMMIVKENRDELLLTHPDTKLYSIRGNANKYSFTIKNLGERPFLTYGYNKKISAKAFKSKLTRTTLMALNNVENRYLRVVDVKFRKDQTVSYNQCLSNHPGNLDAQFKLDKKEFKENKAEFNNYLTYLMYGAIEAYALLERKKYLTETVNNFAKAEYQRIIKDQRKAVGSQKRKRARDNRKLKARIQKRYEKMYLTEFLKVEQKIKTLFSNHYILFELKNNSSFNDWINLDIDVSKLGKRILEGLDKEVVSRLTGIVVATGQMSEALDLFKNEEFLKKNEESRNKLLNNEAVTRMVKSKLRSYIKSVRKGAYDICSNYDDQNLHHNFELVKLTLNDNFKREKYKTKLGADIGGYCYLKETSPFHGKNRNEWVTYGAAASMGLGFISQFFIGPMNPLGTGLIFAGGAALATSSVSDLVYASFHRSEVMTLNSIGIDNLDAYKEISELYYDTAIDLGLEVATASTVLGVGSRWATKVYKNSEKYLRNTLRSSLYSRFLRGIVSKELIDQKNGKKIYELLIKRHEILNEARIGKEKLWKIEASSAKYRGASKVPAIFAYHDNNLRLVRGIDNIRKVTKVNTELAGDVKKYVDDLVTDIVSYRSNLKNIVIDGMDSPVRLKDIEAKLKEIHKQMKMGSSPFFNKAGEVQIVKIYTKKFDIESNSFVDDVIEVTSPSELEIIRNQTKRKANLSLAGNPADEVLKSSLLYNEMKRQAFDVREAELVIAELRMPLRGESEYIRGFKKGLADKLEAARLDPLNRARFDMYYDLKNKERKLERKSYYTSSRAKKKVVSRLMEDSNINISKDLIDDMQKTGPLANIKKYSIYLLGGSTTFGVGGAGSGFFGSFENLHWIQEFNARVGMHYTSTKKYISVKAGGDGVTSEEKKCAIKGRGAAYMLCFTALAKKHLGVHIARISKVKGARIENDPEAFYELVDYAFYMKKVQKAYKGGNVFYMAHEAYKFGEQNLAIKEYLSFLYDREEDLDFILSVQDILEGGDPKSEEHEDDWEYLSESFPEYLASLEYFIENKDQIIKYTAANAMLPQAFLNQITGETLLENRKSIIDENLKELSGLINNELHEIEKEEIF